MDDYKIIVGQENQTVIDKLKAYFNRFCNLLSDDQLKAENHRLITVSISEDAESTYEMVAEPLGDS